MRENKIVYMVTDGDYSDYQVKGIYSTLEKAGLAKKLFASENEIEKIIIDALPEHPEGMLWYGVGMEKNGNMTEIKNQNIEFKITDEWRPDGDNKTITFYMWAKNDNHAVKIANERRIRLIESGEWNTNWNEWKKKRT